MGSAGLEDVRKKIEHEFAKYGFSPMNIEKVKLDDIKKSILQIVTDYIFASVREIVHYAGQKIEQIVGPPYSEERNVGNGILGIINIETVWSNACSIKDAAGNRVELFHNIDISPGGMLSRSADLDRAEIRIGNNVVIFSAAYLWTSANLNTLKIICSEEAKKAFQAISLKAISLKVQKLS